FLSCRPNSPSEVSLPSPGMLFPLANDMPRREYHQNADEGTLQCHRGCRRRCALLLPRAGRRRFREGHPPAGFRVLPEVPLYREAEGRPRPGGLLIARRRQEAPEGLAEGDRTTLRWRNAAEGET